MNLYDSPTNDFIAQLARLKVPINEQHLLSKQQLTERYKYLENVFSKKRSSKDEIPSSQHLISLKIAYINMLLAIKEKNGGMDRPPEERFEKQDVIQLARSYSTDAKRTLGIVEPLKVTDPKRYNPYSDLGLTQIFPIEDIRSEYKKLLQTMQEKLDKMIMEEKFDKESALEMETLYLQISKAYEKLNNPETKQEIDEIIFLNFNPDRSDLYVEGNIGELTYIPEKAKTRRDDRLFILKNSQGDEILLKKTGTLGYGRFRKKDGNMSFQDPEALSEYTVVKKYNDSQLADARKAKIEARKTGTTWDENEGGEVFKVYGRLPIGILSSPSTDINYISYTINVLFSNANLLQAIQCNGGYMGEAIVDKKTEEYMVYHNQDLLCLAKEFEKIKGMYPIGETPVRVPLDLLMTKQEKLSPIRRRDRLIGKNSNGVDR